MLNSRLRILIVDDFAFFRHRIEEALCHVSDIEIVGNAVDGKEAVKRAADLKPDLITMDVRMPGMDGITAVRRIMAEHPTRILMLSAVTKQGATETLEALEAGAIEFLPKEQAKLSAANTGYDFAQLFLDRVSAVGRSRFWSQEERSRVEYGMPQVFEKAGLSNRVLSINDIGQQLIKEL